MTPPQHKLRAAPRGAVRLTDPALAARVRANRAYLMSLDNHNLLQNFLLEAGRLSIRIHSFDDAFQKYHWGWEAPTCQLRGHFLGHWLSAAAQRCQAAGDDELKAKAEAVARDDTPPARYAVGEWQSLPYATLDNRVAMRAMSVTGADGCPRIEPEPVEYYFQCVGGGGPDSGWIGSAFWKSSPLPDGKYVYRFKIRDRSPRRNETPFSTAETVVVSPMTGYHDCPPAGITRRPEGALVSFRGKVAAVEPRAYVVASGQARIRVVPKTVGSATDPGLAGRDVTVKGCVWSRSGTRQVVWAEVK